jgi:hypothetical protein
MHLRDMNVDDGIGWVSAFDDVRVRSRCRKISPLFEIALVLLRLDHVASIIVNANHGMM